MTVSEIVGKTGCCLANREGSVNEITSGYTSDLLSDVMANAREGAILITIQAHNNTVAVAALTGIRAILVCNQRTIPQDMIESSDREKIALLTTSENQFTMSYRIHQILLS